MGHPKPLRLSNFLSAGLLLVLCFGFCVHSSAVSGEVANSKRYIMQSYFEKHEKFSDSDFQDFVAKKLPFGLCEFLPHDLSLLGRVSIMSRNLIGKGSHRHLISSASVSIKPESIFELPSHYCEVIIIERLPSGVFADPFELQHLLQRGVYSNIAVFGDTNLELPSFLSNRSAVEVHMDIGHNILLRHGEDFTINVEIPLHARYPPLDDSGYWEVKFGVPDLFMRCSVEGKSHNQSCLYIMPENDSSEKAYGTFVWKLPSGMKVHAGIVSILTFVAALLSAILIAATSIFYSELNSSKHLKKA